MKPCRYQWVVIFWMLFLFHASATVRYVNVSNSSPASPYTNWLTAATNIQDAVNVAGVTDTVLVTNGIYQYGGNWGGYFSEDFGSNRVHIASGLTVQSINGPAVTIIKGYQVPGTTNGNNAVRCVLMDGGTTLSGFTLTNGATPVAYYAGGGVYCDSSASLVTNCIITNCIITGNVADGDGGGVACYVFGTHCTLINCTISNNISVHRHGGGVAYCTLTNCILTGNSAPDGANGGGGGGYSNILINCTLTGNKASGGGAALGCSLTNCILNNISTTGGGGGAGSSTLVSCLVISNSAGIGGGGGGAHCILIGCSLVGNSALGWGGGANGDSILRNCMLIGNSASVGGGADSCSTYNCSIVGNFATNGVAGLNNGYSIYNCIIYYNTNVTTPFYPANNSSGYTYRNTCTTPLPLGTGNITNEPAFVNPAGGDYHLQSNSPCINAGNNAYVSTTADLDGNPRIKGGTVDIGAYEYQTPTSVISYAWLQQYGLPTDGTADYADSDGDGFSNWNEWRAGTSPTDPSSLLKMTTVTNDVSGITVTWQTVSGITYFLQPSTDLGAQPAFSTIQTDIAGQAGTISYTDTTATNGGPYFYRVGVQ